MPFFNFKGFQKNVSRAEPTKLKEAYENIAPYAYIPYAYNFAEPYAYLPYAYLYGGGDGLRIQMSRQGGDIDLHELIPGEPSPVYNGIDLPDFIKIQGTTMHVSEIPEEIEDEFKLQIEAEN